MFKKKGLFLIIFGIIFFMFGFGGNKQDIQTAEAVGCRTSCNKGALLTSCSPGCYYTDAHADSAGNFGACSVGSALTKCNPIVKYDSDCSSASMSCKEENCGGLVAANGTACVVTLGGWTGFACTTDIKNGIWDASEEKCIQCSGSKESEICADGNSIKLTSGVCEASDNSFETACDASVAADCDDIAEGEACIGGVCDASGQCVVSSDLFLTVSADPLTIEVGGTSTVTFLVRKEGFPVDSATVENITVMGGFVDATSCTTNASGECAVIYTAPPIAGIYGVNVEKATKSGETDSGPAGIVIKVLSSVIPPCGPEIGVLCNPVDNASDFYAVIVIAIRYLLSLIALITFIFIVISGIKYLTSFGNEEKMRSAKDGLTSAIFGLALVLMAYTILEVIIKVLSS